MPLSNTFNLLLDRLKMTAPKPNVRVKTHEPIALNDGCVLSAMTWMPEDAATNPVPAILEYLPYRKKDQTAIRDALNHPYFAAHGYACVRVDMRGSGDSEGVLLGEYLQQEQDDGLEVLKWIAAQPWCTGSVGMIGISWGGFNGVMQSVYHPPELKAVISICSTADRYAGDIHYMGGCLLVDNFTWGASMFAIAPTPPDEADFGDGWRETWLKRLESGNTYVAEWHEHQHRDTFWRHASVNEDYSAVKVPTYLVGGWSDPYSNSIFDMMKNFSCPRKALVGPWGHLYPNFASPKPRIGFLQEALRWWDQHLKGKETGIMNEPAIRCWMQDTVPPQRHFEERPGHWVAESSWPSDNTEHRSMALAPGKLVSESDSSANKEHLSIRSPQTVGFAAGKWLIFGPYPEGPGDQRQDAIGSLVFDTDVYDQPLDILGAPVLQIRVSSDKKVASIAATLSEVLPDGAATRISYAVFNLSTRESDSAPEYLQPGKFYDVTINLNECCQRISAGSRLRVALSTTYFPIIWPAPEAPTLTIDCGKSSMTFPIRPKSPLDSELKTFLPVEQGSPLPTKSLRAPKQNNTLSTDYDTGVVTVRYDSDTGCYINLDTNWCYGAHEVVTCSIHPDDPLSARVEQTFRKEYGQGKPNLVIEGWLRMKASKTDFFITARMDAYEDEKNIFGKDYSFTIPRKFV
ncbi:Alpha/Beta hydrolase protein [Neohortaea acidophila]|uniref:Alpha/Beta hydrolase protein n=1 Tax=Neohortaea acidophila TaxID=245834 RepID=A0A6A6PHJ6_9PEZI|nr:Alpha/Beta hydrolase protein [Neohortaea acidophila]KAF2478747.1 Alpha/Beta hydrolase protein [Neohortaea acidophila]